MSVPARYQRRPLSHVNARSHRPRSPAIPKLLSLVANRPIPPQSDRAKGGAIENAYRISVAVAGFTGSDLSIEAKENTLTIHGEKQINDEEKVGEVLYQGIAARAFERSFQLADYVQVKGATLENGLLHVDLVREIPEAMKPRAIPIASSSKLLAAAKNPMIV
jgi:HSP20 family molecular chaperone IbpA